MEPCKGFFKAQKQWENQLPPEDPSEPCKHHWKFLGTAEDGTSFYRCAKCKQEEEA